MKYFKLTISFKLNKERLFDDVWDAQKCVGKRASMTSIKNGMRIIDWTFDNPNEAMAAERRLPAAYDKSVCTIEKRVER